MICLEVTALSATTMASSFVSSALNVKDVREFAIQAAFTGAPVGTFKLQISCDEGSPNGTSVTNWDDLPDSQKSITTSGSHSWNIAGASYTWVRISYLATSGTGSCTARFVKKRERK